MVSSSNRLHLKFLSGIRRAPLRNSNVVSLWQAERAKNKLLTDRLTVLDENSDGLGSAATDSNGDVGATGVGKLGHGYLEVMLRESKEKNENLQKQIKAQMRQSLDDSDKMMDLTRYFKHVITYKP